MSCGYWLEYEVKRLHMFFSKASLMVFFILYKILPLSLYCKHKYLRELGALKTLKHDALCSTVCNPCDIC